MTIRKVIPADREEYVEMARAFYASPAVIKSVPESNFHLTFDECLSSDSLCECLIIEHSGAIAGYGLILKSFSQEAGGRVIWFDELFIKERYRGQGLGAEFFRYVLENYPAARYRLEVERDNVRAVNLYKKLGFGFLEYCQMIKGD